MAECKWMTEYLSIGLTIEHRARTLANPTLCIRNRCILCYTRIWSLPRKASPLGRGKVKTLARASMQTPTRPKRKYGYN
jgi:hypothetical protein